MNTNNCLPDICEFKIRIDRPHNGVGDLYCIAECRISSGEFPIDEEDFEIIFCRAFISIDLDGLTEVPGSRFGEPKKENAVLFKRSSTSKSSLLRSISSSVGLSVGTSPAAVDAKGAFGYRKSSEMDVVVEASETFERLRVRAKPNLKWEVSEPCGGPLDDTYLNGDNLVSVRMVDRANQVSLRSSVTVKQRDIEIKRVDAGSKSLGLRGKMSINQVRLMDIFIAKTLSSALNWREPYRGAIKLSEYVNEAVGEE